MLKSSLLNLGLLWLPGVLWNLLILHQSFTPLHLKPHWFSMMTHTRSHICLPVLHVGAHIKKTNQVQLQLDFSWLGVALSVTLSIGSIWSMVNSGLNLKFFNLPSLN